METGMVNPNIKEEFILPDNEPLIDCSCVKVEMESEECEKDCDDDSSSSGRLEGLGASLAIIKMEMDLPDSSVSQEISDVEDVESYRYCQACGIPCNSEEELGNHWRILHSDTIMETQRKMDEKANGMGDRDQPASTGFGNRLQGFIDKQVNPRRNVMQSMCLYNCNACRYTSLSKQDVLKHMNSHIEVRVLSCEFCLPLFYDESVKTLGVVPFSCGHCLFRTEELDEMRNHSMVHHKAATCLSELESEEYVSTSQTQQIFNESSGVPKEETVQIADDEVCVDGDRKYNLNKENFCSQQIAGDVTNGAKTDRNYGSSNHALIVEDFQSLSPPAIPRVISQTKANSTIFKAPSGNNGVIPVREFSDNSAAKSKRVVKANRVVAPRKSPRVLRPKLEKHLANPEPAYYTPVSEPTYYMPVSEPPSFSVAVLPVNVAPVMPITVTTPLITSTTGGPQNPIPKKQKIHHKKRCPYCGREARDNYCLKVHMLTHSKEKPFACPYENCYYRATQKAHVMKHLQSERHNTSSRRLKNMPSDIS